MESANFDEQFTDEFNWKMKLIDSDGEEVEIEPGEIHSDDEFSFSFSLTGAGPDGSPVSADDVFQNGQIKPIFPLFDRSLIGFDSNGSEPRLMSPVKVFAETNDSNREGPYCEWSGKAVESSASQPETCKKSNSTGFSKIWRFRDLMHRSSSDGKDAFVFLNSSSAAAKSGGSGGGGGGGGDGEVRTKVGGEKVAKGNKKVGKGKTASSVHEMHYVRNRAVKEGDRRRSYLPYRPELVGFFTNVHGGVRRNMHPF